MRRPRFPWRYGKSKGLAFDDYAVPDISVTALKREFNRLVSFTKASRVDWFSSDIYIGKVGDKKIGLVSVAGWFGAPAMAFVMENLITCGARKVLFSGAFGAFQHDMNIGDFAIPTKAIIGEGTSRYYLPKRRVVRTDPEIVEALTEACETVGVRLF